MIRAKLGAAIAVLVLLSISVSSAGSLASTKFSLLSPNDSWSLDNRPILCWEAIDAGLGLDHYEVWLDGSNIDNVPAGTTSYATSPLSHGNHTWYVVAVGSTGNEHQSDNVFTFSVGAPPALHGEYSDGFEGGDLAEYVLDGIGITDDALIGSYSAEWVGPGTGYAYHPIVALEREGEASVIITLDGDDARAGVGFASKDGTRVYIVTDPSNNRILVERRAENYSIFDVTPEEYCKRTWGERRDEDGYYIWEVEDAGTGPITPGERYRLRLIFSRRSKCVIGILEDLTGFVLGKVTTIVDVAPEHPFFQSGGPARFDDFRFELVDEWYYNWKPLDQPVLSPGGPGEWDAAGAFNPTVFYEDGTFYMFYRGNKIPAPPEGPPASSIGLATSPDGIHWTKYLGNPVLDKDIWGAGTLEDADIVVDPFGDGKYYIEYTWHPPTYAAISVSDDLIHWENHKKVMPGKIVSIIDAGESPYIDSIAYEGTGYRFFAYVEGSTINEMAFSNDLWNWTLRRGTVLGPTDETWAELEDVIADAFVQPDGNVRVFTCGSTREGYVGGAEATTMSAIFDGDHPWELIKRGTIPWFPVYYGDAKTGYADLSAWNDGPNFPGSTVRVDNLLYFYTGANDQYVGMAIATLMPEFVSSWLRLEKVKVNQGESTTVLVNVRNVGSLAGDGVVEIYIDGELWDSEKVTLEPNGEAWVEFAVTAGEPGVHVVQVGGMSSTLLVGAMVGPEGPPIWSIVVVTVVIVVVLAGALWYWRHGKHLGGKK